MSHKDLVPHKNSSFFENEYPGSIKAGYAIISLYLAMDIRRGMEYV